MADKWSELAEKTSERDIDAQCKELFNRSRDSLAREFQVVGLIDDYKRWGVREEDRESHREMMRAARESTVALRNPNEYNPDGTIRRMSVVLRDGRELSEERVYSDAEPSFREDNIRFYIEHGIITEEEATAIRVIFDFLMGRGLPDGVDAKKVRDAAGDAKNKILAFYNEMYKEELFSDDGQDRDGLIHEVDEDGTQIVRFSGASFKMLVHVRNAMHTAQGEKTDADLDAANPREEWENPREGRDYIPRGLSTSLISSEKIHLFRQSEIIFAFGSDALSEDSILSMSEEDIGSSVDAHDRLQIVGSHGNERMMTPDELIGKTGSENAMTNYNEVVLDRMAGGKMIRPTGIIVFGTSTEQITPLQRRYAKAFGVPIYLIDDSKYGGVHSIGE